MKCHSLPSHGFWSRYEEDHTEDILSEDVDINVSRKLQKGISSMFKTLTSSYPESFKWDRKANFTTLVHQPDEIDVKDFRGHRESTELADLVENDVSLVTTGRKGTRLSEKIVRGMSVYKKALLQTYFKVCLQDF